MSRMFLVFLLSRSAGCTAIQRAEEDFSVIDGSRWLSKEIVSISFDLQLSSCEFALWCCKRGCGVGRGGES